MQVLLQLKSLNPVDVTPGESGDDLEAPGDGRRPERRPGFKFPMAEVRLGETIQWNADPDKVAVVAGLSQVIYEGEPVAISRITAMLLGISSKYVAYSDRHWTYEGETLEARRDRLGGRP